MAIENNLISGSTRKYLPARVVGGTSLTVTPIESWLYNDGLGDPWWQGAGGAACRWTIECEMRSTGHSSHLTRIPYFYNGLDIGPGMWVFASGDAKAVRVVSVVEATDSYIKCVVEDVDRYNTFVDPLGLGQGMFSDGRPVVFFELGQEGNPLLNPLPDGTDPITVAQIESRFRSFNKVIETRFYQLDHGFKESQVLRLNSTNGLFENATSDDPFIVGTVTAVGPGPNYFYLAPSTKIITNLSPGLPGDVGEVVYLDPTTGDRTNVPSGAPLYMKLSQEVATYSCGGISEPTTWEGCEISINGKRMIFSSSGANTTSQIISEINLHSADTGVVASRGRGVNLVTGTNAYPSATPATDIVFTLNGSEITVSTPSISFGDSGMVGWWDVIREVNERTHVHQCVASFDANDGMVAIKNLMGGSIEFVAVTPTSTSGEDKTIMDMLGIDAFTAEQTDDRLLLTRADGGPITITEISGSFVYDTGVKSAYNGSLPMALVIDKSMSANANYVVEDVAARDALSNLRTGDQVFVQSAPDGEWALYVKNGASWVKLSDHDSANTDASTLTADIDFESTSPVSMGSISGGTRVANVTVVVDQAFDGAAVLSVGVSGSPAAIMSSDVIDLTVVGSYETTSSFTYQGVTEEEIQVFFTPSGATQGSAKVIVSYL